MLFEKKIGEHGFVKIVDAMGNDQSIVDAARVSYQKGTKTSRNTEGLIRYLMRNRHTSPFEMCEIKMIIRAPIFIARQWMRHRTASINEESARYSVVRNEFWYAEDEEVRAQSDKNKQVGDGDIDDSHLVSSEMYRSMKHSFDTYSFAIEKGVCREQARSVLPVSTYTSFVWKIDLHNLLHFLRLRMDWHAQKEIREYARAIATYVQEWVPETWEAFDNYQLNSVTFSKREMELLRGEYQTSTMELSAGERREFDQKRQLIKAQDD